MMKRICKRAALPFLLLFSFAGISAPAGKFFGDDVERFEATGFFRVEQKDHVWWLVTPDGYAFYSMGVNHISPEGYYAPRLGYSPYEKNILGLYGSKEKWAEATRSRLQEWGFNTIGAWSAHESFPEFPYVMQLNFSSLGGGDWQKGRFPDVFAPEWERKVFAEAQKICAPRKKDPYLIGYFTDNELHWGPDWRGMDSLLEIFLKLPADAPGKKRLVEFFEQRYGRDFSEFERVWRSGARGFEELLEKDSLSIALGARGNMVKQDLRAFDGLVAERYFSVSANAIRSADPNHLILGCRFHALGATPEVIKYAGKYNDVISINYYYLTPVQDLVPVLLGNVDFSGWMKKYYQISGKPIIATEFSYRAITSGLPNTKGAPVTVFSQYDRGLWFRQYAHKCQNAPYVIGYHWFNYMDEPKEGRFDGENSNYGIVDENDRAYRVLVREMSGVNSQAYKRHLIFSEK